MTVYETMIAIKITKFVVILLSIILLSIGFFLIKKNKNGKIFVIIATIIMIPSITFYVAHDCNKYIIHNIGVVIDNENGIVRSSGICMICNKNIVFENHMPKTP